MAIVIQIRRDTGTNWSSANPVLAQGEIGQNLDNGLIKIGDGAAQWSSLDYYGTIASGTLQSAIDSVSTDLENNYYTETEVDSLLSTTSGSLQVQIDTINYNVLDAKIDTTSGTLQTQIDEKSFRGYSVTEIRTLDDFNPSGGIINLSSGHYRMKDNINIGSNRFVFEDDSTVLFGFDDSFNHAITYTGDDATLFSGKATFRCLGGMGTAFLLEGDNAKFIDIVGSFGMEFGFIGFYGSNGSIGNIRGKVINQTATAGLLLTNCVLDGWNTGFAVSYAGEVGIRNIGGEAATTASGVFLDICGCSDYTLAKGSYMNLPATATLFNIAPTIDISASIRDVYLTNEGDFFKASAKSGTFSAVADASIADTAITGVSGIIDDGVRFSFTGPTVYEYQRVTVSGFTTNTDYNGTWTIVNTDGSSYFDVDVLEFGSNELTGSFSSDSVTLTETNTPLVDGDCITVNTTYGTNYDVGSCVYNTQTNSFQVNAPWSVTASGVWTNGSQTENSKFIEVQSCGAQAGSEPIGGIHVTGNTETISATTGDWVDLNLGTAIENEIISRFKLINPTTGEMAYIGRRPFSGILYAPISAFKSGATACLHQFRVYKTVGSSFDEDIIVGGDLTNRINNITFIAPVKLEEGDQFKIQIKSVETGTTVTIENFSKLLK